MRVKDYEIRLKKKGSLIVPLIFATIMALYVRESSRLFFRDPMMLTRLVIYTSIFLFILVLKEELEIKPWSQTAKPEESKKKKLGNSFYFFFFMVGYYGILNFLGFILSTFIFIASGMWFFGIRDTKKLVFVPIGLLLFIYLMFQQWLMIPLPRGFLGF